MTINTFSKPTADTGDKHLHKVLAARFLFPKR